VLLKNQLASETEMPSLASTDIIIINDAVGFCRERQSQLGHLEMVCRVLCFVDIDFVVVMVWYIDIIDILNI